MSKELPGIDLDILHFPFDVNILSSLIHSVPFSVYAKDKDGTFIFANLNYCQNVDKSLKDILGKTDYDIHPADHADKFIADDIMIMSSRKTRVIEESWQSLGGTTHYVQVVKTPLLDNRDPDKVLGTLGVFWDITEKKQVELQIEEERSFLRKVIDSLPAFIYVKDLKGDFILTNKSVATFMGAASPEELVGKNDFDYYPQETAELFAKEEKKIFKTQKPIRDLIEQFTFNGERYWINTTKDVLRDRKGAIRGLIGIGYDITRIKLIEEKLRESEERYAAVIQQAVEGIYLIEPETKTVLDSNESFRNLIGYSRQELHGLKVYDFILHDRKLIDHRLANTTMNAKQVNEERSYRHKDGYSIDVEVSATMIGYSGNKAFMVVVRDISEKKAAEKERERLKEELRQAQKFEALGTLAGGVAHDLNNILSGVVSYPEMILNKLPEGSDLIKPLSVIKDSGKRAATVVADLLTIARSAASSKLVYDLNTIVKEYLASPEYDNLLSHKNNITIHCDLKAEASTILCSSVHIKKCVMNLVENASDAMSGKGKVTIRTVNHKIKADDQSKTGLPPGNYVLLQVIDTGHGISDQELERIFEPFYTKKEMGRSGTGLGLTVVWNTVVDHDGTILVKSSEDGTCFNLYFPYDCNEITSKDEADSQIEHSEHGEHILIVDDQEMLRDIASQILTDLGYKTSAVSSGEKAIEFVQKNRVDLLLIDMLMPPGINGRVTYERVKNIYPELRAVIVSGYSEDNEVQEALNIGAKEFIQKPYSMTKLSQAVKHALS